MTPFALALILAAALMHASWNVLAKRSGGGIPFIFLYFFLSLVIWIPAMLIATAIVHPTFTPLIVTFMIGNGVLHAIYFTLLQRGYRIGDLSLVYPLARGTGPLVATIAAVVLFGERPGLVASLGIACLVVGIFVIGAGPRMLSRRDVSASIGYGIATGCAIAVYTLWDKYAVALVLINPIVYDWWGNFARTAIMSPLVARRGGEVLRAWRNHRWEALGIAVLSPAAYLLILWALITTPVSYVAPAREISIVIGTFFGIRLFSEGFGGRRTAAAGLMFAGIVALALG
jgi:drug/metabolite transporter (DMT)-like permease